MPEDHVDSLDPQAAPGPADGGTPVSAPAAEAQQVDGGGAPEAPVVGTPDSTPAIPDVGSPTEVVKEDSPPATPVDETDWQKRFTDTKTDRDALAEQRNRLVEAGVIDANGNVIERAPAATPPVASDDEEAAREYWNSRYDTKVAELGPIGAHNWAVSQGLLPGGQTPAAAPAAAAPQGVTQDQVQTLITRSTMLDAELASMGGIESYGPDFMNAPVNYGNRQVSRKAWLGIEARRTGQTAESVLMRYDSGSAVDRLSDIKTEAKLQQRLADHVGDGGPSTHGPMTEESLPSEEMDNLAVHYGGNLDGPRPAPYMG